MDLQTLKNTYAKEQGYEDWNEFHDFNDHCYPSVFDKHWREICIRAQKAALEKAADYLQQCSCSLYSDYKSQKMQITNPENLIL